MAGREARSPPWLRRSANRCGHVPSRRSRWPPPTPRLQVRQPHIVFERMGHPFLPLLVLLILPLAFFAYRRGLRSRPITWALYLACLAWLGASAWAGGVPFAELDRIKLMVAAAAIAALVGRSLGLAGLGPRRVHRTTLFLIAAVSWLLYSNFFAFHGIGHERVFIHLHDVAHYYLGAKYFPELGYQSLYTALLRAEAEKYQDHFRSLEARDLETNG